MVFTRSFDNRDCTQGKLDCSGRLGFLNNALFEQDHVIYGGGGALMVLGSVGTIQASHAWLWCCVAWLP